MFKVDEVKNFKVADEELITVVKDILSGRNDDLEDFTFTFKELGYAFVDIGQDNEIDEGKYTVGCYNYQLVSFDTAIAKYPSRQATLDKFNVVVEVSYSKTGSYYSDYEYYYDEPVVKIVDVTMVEEVVIPAHEEVWFKPV